MVLAQQAQENLKQWQAIYYGLPNVAIYKCVPPGVECPNHISRGPSSWLNPWGSGKDALEAVAHAFLSRREVLVSSEDELMKQW